MLGARARDGSELFVVCVLGAWRREGERGAGNERVSGESPSFPFSFPASFARGARRASAAAKRRQADL
jgi:hypothetical protein